MAIDGADIDVRTKGGYVVLPGLNNGRQWLRPLRGTPMTETPAWLDEARNSVPSPSNLLRPVASRKDALRVLKLACAKIIAAPCGRQDGERHRQCFLIGALIARGELDHATAYAVLIAAVSRMPASGRPWRDLAERVAGSIARGMGRAI